MKLRRLLAILAIAAIGTCWSAAGALADSPASDAAQACLQGPQIDYYRVVGAAQDSAPVLDFGSLVHGSDETGTLVVAENNGDCVSFVAKNSKGKSSNTNEVHYLVFVLRTVTVSSVTLN